MPVPTDIGPIGRLAASPRPGMGRIVGLRAGLRAAGQASQGLGLMSSLRDFNDMRAGRIVGAAGGRLVKTRPDLADLGGQQGEDEEEAFARAKQQGRENRAYYRQTIGTPKRRPLAGGFGDDFTDLTKRTP